MSKQGNMRTCTKQFASGLLSGLFLQEKPSDLAKKLSIDDFKAPSGWADRCNFRQCQVKQNHAHQR